MPRTKPFDEHYEKYEEWFSKNRYVYQSELKAIGHFIPQRGKGVEIGIGSGKFAVPFGIKVGVEPSKAMRKPAREKGIRVYNAVAESLPFGAGLFRTEFLVRTAGRVLNEGEQYRIYRQMIDTLSGRDLIVRTFDLDAISNTDLN